MCTEFSFCLDTMLQLGEKEQEVGHSSPQAAASACQAFLDNKVTDFSKATLGSNLQIMLGATTKKVYY